jgi:hypothetical protein
VGEACWQSRAELAAGTLDPRTAEKITLAFWSWNAEYGGVFRKKCSRNTKGPRRPPFLYGFALQQGSTDSLVANSIFSSWIDCIIHYQSSANRRSTPVYHGGNNNRSAGERLPPLAVVLHNFPVSYSRQYPPDIPKRFMAGCTPIVGTKLLLCRAS